MHYVLCAHVRSVFFFFLNRTLHGYPDDIYARRSPTPTKNSKLQTVHVLLRLNVQNPLETILYGNALPTRRVFIHEPTAGTINVITHF